MSSQQVPSSLRDILADILEISPDEVTPELGVGTIDSWDSFRHLQAILRPSNATAGAGGLTMMQPLLFACINA